VNDQEAKMKRIAHERADQQNQGAAKSSGVDPAGGHACPQQLTDASNPPARADVAAGWKARAPFSAGLPLWQVFAPLSVGLSVVVVLVSSLPSRRRSFLDS
jgi:hypothetical protein